MAKPLLMVQNYADPDLILSLTQSSEATVGPSENVLAKTRRTKVWRSAGYWNITSSNNVLKFKETSGGSTLTATIAASEYITDAAFLTAIKTALEVTGDSTYTVSRDATSNKIKILSNGVGGNGVFQLLCTNVGFTAASILGFSTALDLTGALTYTADVLKIHTSEWLRFDFGTASDVQAFILIGKRNEGIQLSSSAVVTLMGNTTDVWTSPQYSQVVDWDEDSMFLIDVAGLYAGGLRYWRLEIVDSSNADGYIEISNIYLGQVFKPTNGAIDFPFEYDHEDYSKTQQSETGVSFTNILQKTIQLPNVSWYALTFDEAEILTEFLENYMSYPFFMSFDPSAVFSSSANKWLKYCEFSSMPKTKLELPNLFSSSWALREAL